MTIDKFRTEWKEYFRRS